MIKLTDSKSGRVLRVGTALYVKQFGPAQAPTLLMVTSRAEAESDLALVVAGGHKRGSVLLILPAEAYDSGREVSKDWLVTNWQRWVDPDSKADTVLVISDILAELDL